MPADVRSVVASRMRQAYHADSAMAAEAELAALTTELDRTHSGAAASPREGMAETLTVLRLGVSPTLARTLRGTSCASTTGDTLRRRILYYHQWHPDSIMSPA